jgi:ArsR family transcriptional regulator, cadmium/lead-responsive transcriptional repressor
VPGLSGSADDRAGAVFAALADPTRRAMVRALRAEPSTASRMAGELPITRQAVAKHLAALRDAGLVEARREGRETRYVLTPAPLADAMAWMAETGGVWDARLARLAERAAAH